MTAPQDKEKTKLAGIVVFPDKEYEEWLNVQNNPDISSAEKIKSTVNTFLNLRWDSQFRHILLDFGFLFDRDDPISDEVYAWKRGSIHGQIANSLGMGIPMSQIYRHPLRFDGLKINEHQATIKVYSWTEFTYSSRRNQLSGRGSRFTFYLKLYGSRWLIQNITTSDSGGNPFPKGTDVNKWVSGMVSSYRTREDLKMSSEESIERFKKTFIVYVGEYIFKGNGKAFEAALCIQGTSLCIKFKDNERLLVLIPVKGKKHEFSVISQDGQFFDLKFINGDENRITGCNIYTLGKQYFGERMNEREVDCESITIFPEMSDAYRKNLLDERNARAARIENDPEYREHTEGRNKKRKEQMLRDKEIEAERLKIYFEIEGDFDFGELGIISFVVKENMLTAQGLVEEEIPLLIDFSDHLEYELIVQNKELYLLQFKRDRQGKITKCVMQVDDKKYAGERIK
ncbi:hypothetical protein ACFLR7_04895 [Acidobacteriota bacterium]